MNMYHIVYCSYTVEKMISLRLLRVHEIKFVSSKLRNGRGSLIPLSRRTPENTVTR